VERTFRPLTVWLIYERLTDLGDIAVAIGNGSVAQATSGILDTAFAYLSLRAEQCRWDL
jgi:hypothetical protein